MSHEEADNRCVHDPEEGEAWLRSRSRRVEGEGDRLAGEAESLCCCHRWSRNELGFVLLHFHDAFFFMFWEHSSHVEALVGLVWFRGLLWPTTRGLRSFPQVGILLACVIFWKSLHPLERQ